VTDRPRTALLGSLIGVTVVSWSLNFIVGKIGLRHMPALTLATLRVTLAAFVIVAVYLFAAMRRRGAAQAPPHDRRFHFDRRDALTFLRLGFLGVVVNQVCFTVGLSYTTVGHAALIIGMGPIFVLLLARLQGLEALTLKKVMGMAAAFAGVAVLAAEHGVSLHSNTLRGDLITFTGSVAFSLYTVLGKKVAEQYDSLAMNTFNYLVGAALLAPLTILECRRLAHGPGWASPGWTGWGAVAFMAVFSSVIAYLIYFWALRYMTASRLATFSYIQPVATTLLGIAWLGDHFTRSLLLGGALILAGVYSIESGPRERPGQEILSSDSISNS